MIDCSSWPPDRLREEVERAHKELAILYKREYRIGNPDSRERMMAALTPYWRDRFLQEQAEHKLTRRMMNAFRDEISESWFAPSFSNGQRVTITESGLKGYIGCIDEMYDKEPYRVDIVGQDQSEWHKADHLEAGWPE